MSDEQRVKSYASFLGQKNSLVSGNRPRFFPLQRMKGRTLCSIVPKTLFPIQEKTAYLKISKPDNL